MERVLIADIGRPRRPGRGDPRLAVQHALQGEDRLPAAARRLGPDPGRGRGATLRRRLLRRDREAQDGGLGHRAGQGPARRARALGLRADRDGPSRSCRTPPRTTRSPRRSTGSTSCSRTGTSGCARAGPHAIMRIRDTAIMSFRAFFHERGFLLIDTPDPDRLHRRERRHPVRGAVLRPRRPRTSRRPGSCTSRPPAWPTAGSTTSARPSGPRSRRPAGT